jgi:hypothetical protein
MPSLLTIASYSTLAFLIALFAIVTWRLARLHTFRALLPGARSRFVAISTLLVAIAYSVQIFRNPNSLPSVSKPLLALLAVSNATYLAPKFRSLFSQTAKIPDSRRSP